MEQPILVSASVYTNKKLNTQAVTKQELRKYQAEQKPKNQTDSLNKEVNKKLFAKADSLDDKSLSSPRIKLSVSQTSKLDGIQTGGLLSHYAQQFFCKNTDVPDNYFI